MKYNNKGLKQLQKSLKQLEKNAKSVEGDNHVPFNEMFNTSFMKKYTDFTNIDSFFDASPFTLETQEDLQAIPEDELDIFVSENTSFNTWQEMLSKAGKEWTAKKLGF
ncbi:hypothetical protein [Oceanobacillus saliphilus]|uniref:hypothetical protein n=1 Tax=Oceanobacillus saliphilus TaxID=2925834 RepID=UPI00201DBA7F|nr:hypothetical protein [Oceanobacillus saliphilus]